MENKKLYLKMSVFVAVTVASITAMAAILVQERQRMREIEAETVKIQEIRSDINAAHRRITALACWARGW